MNQATVDRKYKNNLFIYLFMKKKEYALSLYNAVNGSNYTNEKDLQFKLLEDMRVDRLKMKLSDAFEVPDESKGFEWTATVLNINPGFNEELFEHCEILREYARFVEVVRRNAQTLDMKEAMVEAIRECMEEGVLVDFLKEYGKEMGEMSWRIYDTEEILRIQHEEALEDALEKGRAEGRAEERSNSEKIIFSLRQEIEYLKSQLVPKVQ